jgi:hypothetical protein
MDFEYLQLAFMKVEVPIEAYEPLLSQIEKFMIQKRMDLV